MTAYVEGNDIVFHGDRSLARDVGASWDAPRGAWIVPATRQNARRVATNDATLARLLDDLVTPWTTVRDDRLYAFQRDVAGQLVSSPRGCIVVMSPGLGKTATAVVAADHLLPPGEQIMVVAPASLLRTWEREIGRWRTDVPQPDDVYVVRGKIDPDRCVVARWVIMSWDRAGTVKDWGGRWPLAILDESVLVKSRSSRRFRKMKELRNTTDRFWLLSGSPTTRYTDDLWTQLHLIWPAAFRSYWRFTERYCYVEITPWGKKVTGVRSDRDVMEENSDLIVVVNQEDVLNLPDYLFETIDVDLGSKQRREYRTMEDQFVATLYGEDVIAKNEVARLQKLQQIASWWDGYSAKHDALIDLVESYEAPHLVWTHWVEGADELDDRLRGLGKFGAHVDGSTPLKRRDEILEQFKAGGLEYLVLSIGVGKFGHTLTNAKTIWYVDKTWNADDYFQSLHRVKRIGLTHRPVVVTLRAPGTVDELVEDNLSGKLGGISRLTKSDLRELLRGLGR